MFSWRPLAVDAADRSFFAEMVADLFRRLQAVFDEQPGGPDAGFVQQAHRDRQRELRNHVGGVMTAAMTNDSTMK